MAKNNSAVVKSGTRGALLGVLVGWALVCMGAAGGAGPAPVMSAARYLQLHRPSPDWRDQVLYFVMTDRFADGDPRNNDQGAGEYLSLIHISEPTRPY